MKNWWMMVGCVGLVAASLGLSGCKKIRQLAGQAAGETAEAAVEGESGEVKAEPALITGAAPGPASVKWERAEPGGLGSIEVPAGDGWEKQSGPGLHVHNEKLDITVMVQHQPAIPPEARSEYLASLIDVNKRDAPKYEVTGKAEGGVNQHVAGRVDGKFDNGTAYATRDYVLFVKNAALALMVRGPAAQATDVQGIADHVASSFR